MEKFASYGAAFLPVLLFLGLLRLLDSFKLVPGRRIVASLGAGTVAAGLSYFLNTAVFQMFPEQAGAYARFGAPVAEQLAKCVFWIYLIRTARVAFMVDAGICGFAVGAGFALAENFFYLHGLAETELGVSIVRGFGTALMHGGVDAMGAMMAVFFAERFQARGVRKFLPGLAAATAIHSLFNQSLLSPIGSTIAVLLLMPALLIGGFQWSEVLLRKWMGEKLDRDFELIRMMATGEFGNSRPGLYLQSLSGAFSREVLGDMFCLLQLTIELSGRAKGALLLQEAGLPVPVDPELDAQFEELAYLRKSIGPTGMLAIGPLLSQTPRDLWEMRRLEKGR